MSRVDEHYWIDILGQARLLFLNLRQNFICNVADEAVGNLKAVKFLDGVGNLTRTLTFFDLCPFQVLSESSRSDFS